MKIIILEGVDLAGKTSAARELLGYGPIVHWSAPPKMTAQSEIVQYWKEAIMTSLTTCGPLTPYCIWDRSFLGNVIYGEKKKDQAHLSRAQAIELFLWLAQQGIQIDFYLFRARIRELKARMGERAETYVDLKEMSGVQAAYRDAVKLLKQHDHVNFKVRQLPFGIPRDKVVPYIIKKSHLPKLK